MKNKERTRGLKVYVGDMPINVALRKFKQKVVPGDTMILKMERIGPIRRGLCEMQGTVYV